MQIKVYCIEKKESEFKEEIERYIQMSRRFATLFDFTLYNNKIEKASSKDSAQSMYDELYLDKLDGYNIALDEKGKLLDSFEFAKLFDSRQRVNFFIGGAYGLSDKFKQKVDSIISLTPLTMAHKVAKLVLYEQIYRALTIRANHPYHK